MSVRLTLSCASDDMTIVSARGDFSGVLIYFFAGDRAGLMAWKGSFDG
jgi:hypothetical protein